MFEQSFKLSQLFIHQIKKRSFVLFFIHFGTKDIYRIAKKPGIREKPGI